MIQCDDAGGGGEPKLPGFQDHVSIVHPRQEPDLVDVWQEWHDRRSRWIVWIAFDHDLVENA
ncbi:hypothetical protein PAF17_15990 [Paracoccus sp. Z330]|uniref:Uncharacterized protein n=1 Tax=Paracoccus onchidii TaxID=3017813 RepID=A0ABT4ZI08_9RHOB|nr:hypothetical protein [Paracoccus onchidii]MDB6178993.1 hypothetical protein [Paracoccus onchidii]